MLHNLLLLVNNRLELQGVNVFAKILGKGHFLLHRERLASADLCLPHLYESLLAGQVEAGVGLEHFLELFKDRLVQVLRTLVRPVIQVEPVSLSDPVEQRELSHYNFLAIQTQVFRFDSFASTAHNLSDLQLNLVGLFGVARVVAK